MGLAIRTTAELVLRAAASGQKNTYLIGPYGARVSFASQQRRALNTVWAIKADGQWPGMTEPRAVVIGGGIAGAMCAIALRAQRCAVHLYEQKTSVMHVQRKASHRFVHPSINFWPEEENLHPTTEFPFLDWYAADCRTVFRHLRQQWRRFEGRVINTHFEQTASEIKWDRKIQKVRVKFRSGEETTADLVFVCTGFGQEDDYGDPAQRSYWQEDNLDDEALTTQSRLVVSGTGDGGLIDALRMVYPGFMEDEILLKYLLAVNSESLRTRVQELEEEAEDKSGQAKSKFYAEQYKDISQDRDPSAKDLLRSVDGRRFPVRLLGMAASPFEPTSAPIHKMILAHALKERHIEYTQGTVRWSPPGYSIETEAGSSQIEFERMVVRHGSKPPIGTISGLLSPARVRSQQHMLGDFLIIPDRADEFFNNEDVFPSFEHSRQGFVQTRLSLAQGFLSDRHNLAVEIDPAKPAELMSFAKGSGHPPTDLERLPASIFRIPVRYDKQHPPVEIANDLVARL
jgi:hypothetical protein